MGAVWARFQVPMGAVAVWARFQVPLGAVWARFQVPARFLEQAPAPGAPIPRAEVGIWNFQPMTLPVPNDPNCSLWTAAAFGWIATVGRLLAEDPDIEEGEGPKGFSPLHAAAAGGHYQVLVFFFFFFTLVTGPRRSLSLKLSDTTLYEPQIRARLGTTAHFCEVVVLKLKTVPLGAGVAAGARGGRVGQDRDRRCNVRLPPRQSVRGGKRKYNASEGALHF